MQRAFRLLAVVLSCTGSAGAAEIVVGDGAGAHAHRRSPLRFGDRARHADDPRPALGGRRALERRDGRIAT